MYYVDEHSSQFLFVSSSSFPNSPFLGNPERACDNLLGRSFFEPWAFLPHIFLHPSFLPPSGRGGGVTLIRWCTHPLWGARNGRPSFTSIPQLTSVQLQYPAAILFFFFFFFFFIFFFFAKATAFHPFFSRSYTLWPRYLCWVRLINIWTPVPSHTFICMCIHR